MGDRGYLAILACALISVGLVLGLPVAFTPDCVKEYEEFTSEVTRIQTHHGGAWITFSNGQKIDADNPLRIHQEVQEGDTWHVMLERTICENRDSGWEVKNMREINQ